MALPPLIDLQPGVLVGDRWIIRQKLGAGAFGTVFLCYDDQGNEGALKAEPMDACPAFVLMEVNKLFDFFILYRFRQRFC